MLDSNIMLIFIKKFMELNTIKTDLLNKFTNDLYMSELELDRLINNTTMSYNIQLSKIEVVLKNIIMINTKISALNNYLKSEE